MPPWQDENNTDSGLCEGKSHSASLSLVDRVIISTFPDNIGYPASSEYVVKSEFCIGTKNYCELSLNCCATFQHSLEYFSDDFYYFRIMLKLDDIVCFNADGVALVKICGFR